MDPIRATVIETIMGQARKFLAVIDGLSDSALNWRPGPETNSLAVLVVHTWSAAQAWTARARGGEIDRNRRAEFRSTATAAELRVCIVDASARVVAFVRAIDPAEFGAYRTTAAGERVTVSYCLIHALEHTQEHLGQAFLTRQLWEQQYSTETTAENEDGYRIPEEGNTR